MVNPGHNFRDSLIALIQSWSIDGLEIYKEPYVGTRFVGAKRRLDIVLFHGGRSLGIECKTQQTSGTAYQKLPYSIEDARRTPIPTIIVFSGSHISDDVKALLVSSGIGLEVEWTPTEGFGTGEDILKQRIQIEMGLNWLADQQSNRVT